MQRLPEAEGADPAVLVVDGRNAPRRRNAQPFAHRAQVLLVRRVDVAIPEAPARLLPQDPGRLPRGVALHHTAVDLEIAVRPRESSRVQPERVRVLREERDGNLARHRIEDLLRRSLRPLGVAPAAPAEPAAGPRAAQPISHARYDLLHRPRALEPDLTARQSPGREVDMGVREPRQDATSAEIDALRARQRGLVGSDPARDAVTGDGHR